VPGIEVKLLLPWACILALANLLASTEETKPTTTKANIHPEHKNTAAQNELKPGLVASYDLLPGHEQAPILQLLGPTMKKLNLAQQMQTCINKIV